MTKTIYLCSMAWREGCHTHHVAIRAFTTTKGAQSYCNYKNDHLSLEEREENTHFYWERTPLHTGTF